MCELVDVESRSHTRLDGLACNFLAVLAQCVLNCARELGTKVSFTKLKISFAAALFFHFHFFVREDLVVFRRLPHCPFQRFSCAPLMLLYSNLKKGFCCRSGGLAARRSSTFVVTRELSHSKKLLFFSSISVELSFTFILCESSTCNAFLQPSVRL